MYAIVDRPYPNCKPPQIFCAIKSFTFTRNNCGCLVNGFIDPGGESGRQTKKTFLPTVKNCSSNGEVLFM